MTNDESNSNGSISWLRLIAAAEPSLREDAATQWQEAKELNLIFGKMIRSCDGK
jgi:hypothetical protein